MNTNFGRDGHSPSPNMHSTLGGMTSPHKQNSMSMHSLHQMKRQHSAQHRRFCSPAHSNGDIVTSYAPTSMLPPKTPRQASAAQMDQRTIRSMAPSEPRREQS